MTHYLLLLLTSLMLSTQCNTVKTDKTSVSSTDIKEKKGTFPVAEYTKEHKLENYATAIFAGGCFWCTEAAFERIEGVVDVISGYSGGKEEYPTYYAVGGGQTGHAEAIYIYYDTEKIDYKTLLEVFFVAAHDPTTLNRQGPDSGPEYRSAVYYKSEEERLTVENEIKKVNEGGYYDDKVVTQVEPYQEFWVAEGYHQNYYELNPNQGYVRNISRPKVLKVKKTFPNLIKEKYKN